MFDDFKDEKISDYKTVSVAPSKNKLDWKLPGVTNVEQLLLAVFNWYGEQKDLIFSKNIAASAQKIA